MRGLLGSAIGAIGTALLILVLFGGNITARYACVTDSDTVHYESWGFKPLALLGESETRSGETCETQTLFNAGAEYVPVFGESVERASGGPSNPAYYANN